MTHGGSRAFRLKHVTDKVSVDLSGPAQTMLTTLYCKALDADFDRPILGDGFAKDAVGRFTAANPRAVAADDLPKPGDQLVASTK